MTSILFTLICLTVPAVLTAPRNGRQITPSTSSIVTDSIFIDPIVTDSIVIDPIVTNSIDGSITDPSIQPCPLSMCPHPGMRLPDESSSTSPCYCPPLPDPMIVEYTTMSPLPMK
ncbi:unnamed protein product, partial [Mesorhabditis belari]|uniref:Uncharacterized protein n=1 Tax=Mesorhabditis belari TaxID=2138241 RepID=A0AAF3JBM5_9BILA